MVELRLPVASRTVTVIAYLQREPHAVQAVLGALRRGVAAPPVEGDPPDTKAGAQASAAHEEVPFHVDGHWNADTWP